MLMFLFREFDPYYDTNMTEMRLKSQIIISCSSTVISNQKYLVVNLMTLMVLSLYIFVISQLWLTSRPRSTVVLLDTCRNSSYQQRFYSEDANGDGYKPNALAIELNSSKCYCWEGVEFILLVYCIIVYLSFLNYG